MDGVLQTTQGGLANVDIVGVWKVGKMNNEFLGIKRMLLWVQPRWLCTNYFSGVDMHTETDARRIFFLFVVHVVCLADDERCYVAV